MFATVYPFPGDVTKTSWIWPGITIPSESVPSATVICTNPPSPSPPIGTLLYVPTAYSVPGSLIWTLSIWRVDSILSTIGSLV